MNATVSSLPKYLSQYLVEQELEKYSLEEKETWRLFLEGRIRLINEYHMMHHVDYREAMVKLGLSGGKIPSVSDLNKALSSIDWTAVCVNGFVPPASYAEFLSRQIFPVSRSFRKIHSLNESATPDFIHDVIGHLPMLFVRDYRDYLKRLAALIINAAPNLLDRGLYKASSQLALCKSFPENTPGLEPGALERQLFNAKQQLILYPSELTHLNRIFQWTIEYGLVRGKKNEIHIIGASILTSQSQFDALLTQRSNPVEYTSETIRHEIDHFEVQKQLFVAKSYDQLNQILENYSSKMSFKFVQDFAS